MIVADRLVEEQGVRAGRLADAGHQVFRRDRAVRRGLLGLRPLRALRVVLGADLLRAAADRFGIEAIALGQPGGDLAERDSEVGPGEPAGRHVP